MASLTLFNDQPYSEQEVEDKVDARQIEQQLQRNRGQLGAELRIIITQKEMSLCSAGAHLN